ncbi:hypothetical protein H6G98_37045 [Nostoc sp. FACHB-857]|nr:hypothetical protein [Nostoc sp. FACHB-857]
MGTGEWGDGEMGRWGDGEMGRSDNSISPLRLYPSAPLLSVPSHQSPVPSP